MSIRRQAIIGLVNCCAILMVSAQGDLNYNFFILENIFAKAQLVQAKGEHLHPFALRDIILKLPTKEICKAADQGGLFTEGFPDPSIVSATSMLFEFITGQDKFVGHEKKAEFVEPMLERLPKLQVPNREAHDWNEAAVIARGGIAGIFIDALPKLCRKEDCAKIVDAIRASKDAAKIERLKASVKNSPYEAEFNKLLDKPFVAPTGTPNALPPSSGKAPASTAPLVNQEPLSEPIKPSSVQRNPGAPPESSSWMVGAAAGALGLIALWLLLKKRR